MGLGLLMGCMPERCQSSTQTMASPETKESTRENSAPPNSSSLSSQGSPTPSVSQPNVIVFLGDSLTAGYGLEAGQSFPDKIQAKLKAEGLNWNVVNAGVSGDTSKGALDRVDWLLKSKPNAVFVCIGANDGLRGLSPVQMKQNLMETIQKFQSKNVRVLMGGMKMPSNYGPQRVAEFEKVYTDISSELKIPLMPFLIEGVALDPKFTLPDGIHPNEAGTTIMADNVYSYLKSHLFQEGN